MSGKLGRVSVDNSRYVLLSYERSESSRLMSLEILDGQIVLKESLLGGLELNQSTVLLQSIGHQPFFVQVSMIGLNTFLPLTNTVRR